MVQDIKSQNNELKMELEAIKLSITDFHAEFSSIRSDHKKAMSIINDIQDVEQLRREFTQLRPVTGEELREVVNTSLAPIINTNRQLREGVEEVRDVVLTNGLPGRSEMGLGSELMLANTTARMEALLNPVKESMAKIASKSDEIRTTMEWNLHRAIQQACTGTRLA
ncbi:unnamed protein product [Chilo suppressalis]|uniref:Uncharacterized protein n=1 Tax=Chilo suppressalis TaxID=168631 RepID=A0ABN8AUZ9_CHISP|nr:unnamed protein product [Chilo suppressalis]